MEDADLDLAVEGALFAGFGTAGQRCTSLGTAIVQDSIHDEFVRRLDERLRTSPIGDPTQDVLYGPMLHEKFAERFEDWLGLIRDHHTPYGSTAQGRIGAAQPARGLRRRPRGGDLLPPDVRDRRDARGRDLRDGDVRPARRRRAVLDLGGGDRARQRPRLRPLLGDLHDEPDARLPLPRADQRRHGVDQQLDVGRRGAPALRRQRQVGQRLAPVGHLGARPVHPLAVDELGLRRQAAEGADGPRRDRGRSATSGSRSAPSERARGAGGTRYRPADARLHAVARARGPRRPGARVRRGGRAARGGRDRRPRRRARELARRRPAARPRARARPLHAAPARGVGRARRRAAGDGARLAGVRRLRARLARAQRDGARRGQHAHAADRGHAPSSSRPTCARWPRAARAPASR